MNRSRLLALFVLVVLPGLIVLWAAFNFVAATQSQALAADTRAQTARFAGRVPSTGAATDYTAVFVDAPSRSLAEAELQRIVASMVETTPASLIESSTLDLRQDDATIAVRATFDIGNEALLRLLGTIETGLPLMFVDEIAVRNLQGAAETVSSEPTLRVEMSVRSRYRDGAS